MQVMERYVELKNAFLAAISHKLVRKITLVFTNLPFLDSLVLIIKREPKYQPDFAAGFTPIRRQTML